MPAVEDIASVEVAAQTAVSDVAADDAAADLLQGSFCSAVTWPRSLFASVDASGATVDIHTSTLHTLCSTQFGPERTNLLWTRS